MGQPRMGSRCPFGRRLQTRLRLRRRACRKLTRSREGAKGKKMEVEAEFGLSGRRPGFRGTFDVHEAAFALTVEGIAQNEPRRETYPVCDSPQCPGSPEPPHSLAPPARPARKNSREAARSEEPLA